MRTSSQKQRKCGSTTFINTDNLCQFKLFVWLQSWDLPNSFSFQLIYYHSIILSSPPEAGQNTARGKFYGKEGFFFKNKAQGFLHMWKGLNTWRLLLHIWITPKPTSSHCPWQSLLPDYWALKIQSREHPTLKMKRLRKKTKNQKPKLNKLLTLI